MLHHVLPSVQKTYSFIQRLKILSLNEKNIGKAVLKLGPIIIKLKEESEQVDSFLDINIFSFLNIEPVNLHPQHPT